VSDPAAYSAFRQCRNLSIPALNSIESIEVCRRSRPVDPHSEEFFKKINKFGVAVTASRSRFTARSFLSSDWETGESRRDYQQLDYIKFRLFAAILFSWLKVRCR
jgi:hypothetical protein